MVRRARSPTSTARPQNPNLLRVARPPVADRPRRRAVPPARGPGPGSRRRRARSRRSPSTCCCRCAGSIAEADGRLAPQVDRRAARGGGRAGPGRLARPGRTPRRRLRRVPAGAAGGAARASPRRRSVPVAPSAFSYAIVRVVPRVERGERAQRRRRPVLPPAPLPRRAGRARRARACAALAPGARPAAVRAHLDAIERIAAGDPAAGPIAALDPSERFGWLVAPSSTMIQPSRGPHRA